MGPRTERNGRRAMMTLVTFDPTVQLEYTSGYRTYLNEEELTWLRRTNVDRRRDNRRSDVSGRR